MLVYCGKLSLFFQVVENGEKPETERNSYYVYKSLIYNDLYEFSIFTHTLLLLL